MDRIHRHARGTATELAPAEIQALLAALAERSELTRKGHHFALRSPFVLAYEEALRPTALDLLRWRDVTLAGLHIRAEVDKNRRARVVPLSKHAREPLAALTPGSWTDL